MNMTLHTHTPALGVIDPRGLVISSVALYRSVVDQPVEARVTHQRYDVAGRLVSQRDPRLTHSNLNTIYSLGGQGLLSDSVDAGWRLGLLGESGQIVEGWDGRGSQRQVEYDALLRPLTITEQGQVSERLSYGGADAFEHNQCNQVVRHDDTAGTRYWLDYGLPGSPLSEVRRFLLDVEMPDWPLAEAERDALLEDTALQTQWRLNALDEAITQTDAMGHTQHFRQTVAGQLKTVDLTLAGAEQAQVLVSDIHYNAFDQVEQETAGNGVVSHALYDPQDGRLMERSASLLQHLTYMYDPAGNIVQIEDTAQPVRFFANQRVEPANVYRYDTLYQLIEATGREVNAGASHGPELPGLQPLPPDPNQVSNYTQTYDYDAAGNLLQLRHVGAQSFTRTLRVAPDSNRSLPQDEVDVNFSDGFDANGNLLHLIRGQTLEWDIRNQLQRITTVTRTTQASDHERYIYDAQGQRCRKINSSQTSSRTLTNEVRYLPGLEIRTTADGEILHVITAQNARVLHWQAGQPSGITNDQIRYSLSDHLGSSTLELDQQGSLISQESYYPFGGTAWWAARSVVEAKYKTVRYSGKERDASGLYYYGFRYYAPWLQHWINPDPAGNVNGLNFFCFVVNAPITHTDVDGRIYKEKGDITELIMEAFGYTIHYRGLSEFPESQREYLIKSLEEAHEVYKNALHIIKSNPEQTTPVMRSFFGYEHKKVTPRIIESWEKIHSLISEYKGGLGEDKFIGVTSATMPTQAFVSDDDPHGRIAIDLNNMNTSELPLVIGHEVSHLKDISGSKTKGPHTNDYYYLFNLSASDLALGGNTLNQNAHQAVAEIITGGGMNPVYFSRFEQLSNGFINRIKSLHPSPESIMDLQGALNEFNRNPGIAAEISAENADSLTFSAYRLHMLHTKNSSRPFRI